MAEGERLKNEALNEIRVIEEEIRRDESQVREYKGKVSDYYFRISEAQTDIRKTKEDLKKIQEKTEELMKHLVDAAEIQKIVRQTVNLLSTLSGRVTVLEKQTQRFILREPVVNVMKEVMMAAINIAENRFLYSRGLPGLINTLRKNSGRLSAIRYSSDDSAHVSYY